MQTITELGDENLLEKLTSCMTVEGVKKGTNKTLIKQIKGFQIFFKQLAKTPSMLRMLLHNEFSFIGQVDFMKHEKMSKTGKLPADRMKALLGESKNTSDIQYTYSGQDLLDLPWHDVSFVVPDYGNMDKWAKKMKTESDKGKTVVAIVPNRSNTNWFHTYVIPYAEIRFLKGRMTFPGFRAQTPFPDIIAIFRPMTVAQDRTSIDLYDENKAKIAIISCFTGDTKLVDHRNDDEEEEDEDEDEY
jgi:hypothetical protein